MLDSGRQGCLLRVFLSVLVSGLGANKNQGGHHELAEAKGCSAVFFFFFCGLSFLKQLAVLWSAQGQCLEAGPGEKGAELIGWALKAQLQLSL